MAHGPYYREIREGVDAKPPATYWLDRAAGSPTPLEFSITSDMTSDVSVASDMSSISSRGKPLMDGHICLNVLSFS